MINTLPKWPCTATLSLLAASACGSLDLDESLAKPVACGAVSSARGIGDAVQSALGASPQSLRADSGEAVTALKVACMSDACESRIAQVGTQIDVRFDVTEFAASKRNGIQAETLLLESTDADVIQIADGGAKLDPCSNNLVVDSEVAFVAEGHAALRVRSGTEQLARFSFEVAQASSLEVGPLPNPAMEVLQITAEESGIHSVRGRLDAGLALRVQARDADGRMMLLDNRVVSTIDDTSVARFVGTSDPTTAHGVHLYVLLLKEGSTTLRAESFNLTTAVELHAEPGVSPPSRP